MYKAERERNEHSGDNNNDTMMESIYNGYIVVVNTRKINYNNKLILIYFINNNVEIQRKCKG